MKLQPVEGDRDSYLLVVEISDETGVRHREVRRLERPEERLLVINAKWRRRWEKVQDLSVGVSASFRRLVLTPLAAAALMRCPEAKLRSCEESVKFYNMLIEGRGHWLARWKNSEAWLGGLGMARETSGAKELGIALSPRPGDVAVWEYSLIKDEFRNRRTKKIVEGYVIMRRNSAWWLPGLKSVILLERPEKIHTDSERRLHARRGPAIRYRDGWALWFSHGTIQKTSIPDPYSFVLTA